MRVNRVLVRTVAKLLRLLLAAPSGTSATSRLPTSRGAGTAFWRRLADHHCPLHPIVPRRTTLGGATASSAATAARAVPGPRGILQQDLTAWVVEAALPAVGPAALIGSALIMPRSAATVRSVLAALVPTPGRPRLLLLAGTATPCSLRATISGARGFCRWGSAATAPAGGCCTRLAARRRG